MTNKKRIIYALLILVLFFFSGVWFVGSLLSQPTNHSIQMPAPFESIRFQNTRGSLLITEDLQKCALLMHGVRSDRTSMVQRAYFLNSLGITSLLIDLQAHGETPGEMITFGVRESNDARNSVNYLRNTLGCKKILTIGQSLGGASALLGPSPIEVDALVLEMVYPTIEDAVADRLEIRLGKPGRLLAPPLYWQIPIRSGISVEQLRPIDAIKNYRGALLIIGGSKDQHTKLEETQRLFNAAIGDKDLWIVEGAKHQDLFKFSPAVYRQRLTGFIAQNL